MALQYVISTGAVTLVTATPKTVLEIPTGSTVPFQIVSMDIMSQATSAGTLIVEWGTYTTTGIGTTVTAQKWGVDQSIAAILGTVKIADTSEPGGFAVGTLPSWVIPTPGMYSIIYPYGREFYQPISTLRCLRVTSSIAAPCRINLVIEQ